MCSESSTPSISQRGCTSGTPGSKRQASAQAAVDLAPAAGSPAGSPLSQPVSDVNAFASSEGFMPVLTDNSGLSVHPHFTVPADSGDTPPPVGDAGASMVGPSGPPTGSSTGTDGLLHDTLPSPEDLLPKPVTAADDLAVTEEHAEVGGDGGVELQVREALAALSVSGPRVAAGSLSDGVPREVKALMADSVASKVAAVCIPLGCH